MRLRMDLRTTPLYFRVDRRQINLIRFVFEAYEGLAVVTTLDAAKGIIALAVAPHCEETALAVMADLSQQIRIEAMDAPEEDFAY